MKKLKETTVQNKIWILLRKPKSSLCFKLMKLRYNGPKPVNLRVTEKPKRFAVEC